MKRENRQTGMEITGRQEGKAAELRCNCCGKRISVKHGIPQEEFLRVDKTMGYFSKKDGIRISFRICEDCLTKWMERFAVPVEMTEETEYFPE